MKYTVTTATEQPNQLEITDPYTAVAWPQFMHHDSIANKYWAKLYTCFSDYQFTFTNPDNNEIVAIANSIPFQYDKPLEQFPHTGWDFLFEKGMNDFQAGSSPNILSALSIVITENYQGKGISKLVLQEMRKIALRKNHTEFVAPVRPNMKSLYPITPIEEYIHWKNQESKLFDSWLRVHESIGGKIIKVCHEAMKIPGTIAEWESWANMKFPVSGKYTVPGALVPISIDIEKNKGLYIEPNVLVQHNLNAKI